MDTWSAATPTPTASCPISTPPSRTGTAQRAAPWCWAPAAPPAPSRMGCASAAAHGWTELPPLLGAADLVVNATLLGMAGKPVLDIDLALLKPEAIVYDIVYVPLETALLRAARGRC